MRGLIPVAPTEGTVDLRSCLQGLGTTVFDTDGYPQRQRFEATEAFASPVYQLESMCEDYEASFRLWPVGGLLAMTLSHEANCYHLKPPSKREADLEVLHIGRVHRGSLRGVAGDLAMNVSAGEIYMVDQTRIATGISEGKLEHSVMVPFKRIGFDPSCHAAYVSMTTREGFGRLFDAALETLLATPPDHPDAKAVGEALVAVLRYVLLGRIENEHSRRAIETTRRAEFRAYIEANLTDPELSVEQVCRIFGVSRATVYRDFAEAGGIRHYIQARRLQHVRDTLARMAPDRGAVTRVAERFGFVSQAHFHRAFRAAYGTTPGEILGSETSGQSV